MRSDSVGVSIGDVAVELVIDHLVMMLVLTAAWQAVYNGTRSA